MLTPGNVVKVYKNSSVGRHLSQSQLPHLIRNQNQIRRFQYFDTFYFHFSFNEITEKRVYDISPDHMS